MFSNFKTIFNSNQSNPKLAPKGKKVKGDYKDLIPFVENDISATKIQLQTYKKHPLFKKMFHLLESNHITEKNTLDNLNQQDTYHEELFELRKRQLNEYTDLLETFKNNYVHSLYENTISLTKHNRNSRSSSVFSGKASLYSSTDEIDKISLDDAPDYLLDPISYELFIDPVISPSGITYEKATLIDHLQKNGKFDPITRQALHEDQLYPNLIMKDTVEAYIEQNRYVN